jgi:amino acid transporter
MALQDPASARQRDRPDASPEGTEATPRSSRVLGVRSLALISVAAVLTLRGMPSVAEYGWSSIVYYLLGALFFFAPLALVVAELETGWPKAGGLYAWVKEGFGDRPGFLAVWFEWVENILYSRPCSRSARRHSPLSSTLALVSTWMLGPAKGLYATEQAGDLIPQLEYVNKRHVPVAILVFQAALSSMLALLFLFVPSINTGYWMLTALTTQLVLMMYILVLCAAIRLRYSEPNADRPYRVPGGTVGIWIVAGMGLLGCVFGFVMGFIPPTGVKH